MALNIQTKNNTEQELATKVVIEYVIKKYSVPLYTSNVLIEEKVIPHSHPVLTLNTRTTEPLFVLKTFVHEQFHWFVQNNEKYAECIMYLKKYPDLGDCNKTGTYPNSFWEHLIVCWNTKNFLNQLLDIEKINFIDTDRKVYPLTEKFVEENFETLKKDLSKWQMVYNF
ncbi:MAG: hypothetical protein NT068_02305 [Candidatus Nomurabacteria bacterium]|nr:hypothetical protein [Candidatus Nomurabacteria bacterium]